MEKIGIVILAAGNSSRLGFPKQLLEIDGESLLLRTVSMAQELSDCVVTVLGYNYKRHHKEITDITENIAFNLDWNKGIGNSIKCGFNTLHRMNSDLCAVVLLNCDQPYVTKEVIKLLTNELKEGSQLIMSSYNDHYGLPAVVGRQYFKELNRINDEETLESLTEVYGAHSVPFPKGVFDIDTVEDWDYFCKKD
ncbi:MAG TPA: nucleotidyltransferase family protein [Fulvivirga sp.]|nr:nucleotidyltransferase family protein [Fulvivirga sp.]